MDRMADLNEAERIVRNSKWVGNSSPAELSKFLWKCAFFGKRTLTQWAKEFEQFWWPLELGDTPQKALVIYNLVLEYDVAPYPQPFTKSELNANRSVAGVLALVEDLEGRPVPHPWRKLVDRMHAERLAKAMVGPEPAAIA